MDAQVDVLVSEQAGFILQRTGMTALYNTVIQHDPKQVGWWWPVVPPWLNGLERLPDD